MRIIAESFLMSCTFKRSINVLIMNLRNVPQMSIAPTPYFMYKLVKG